MKCLCGVYIGDSQRLCLHKGRRMASSQMMSYASIVRSLSILGI